MFIFDWTVNVGNIITILMLGVGIVGLYYGLTSDIRFLKYDVQAVKDQQKVTNESLTQLSNILTKVAVQDTRITMIEKNVDELRHGKGMVK